MDINAGLLKLTRNGRRGQRTFIAPNATIVGDVMLGDDVTVLFGAILRADMASITIGNRSNVQDNAVIHESVGHPVTIGNDVSIGHGAIIHGCTIEDGCLIGMGAIVLNDAIIGKDSLIAAGSLISERKIIPPNSLVMGVPGKIVRELSADEVVKNLENAESYVNVGKKYRSEWE
jgi:carbonic anhydrase/acetyltransferase-like protein (isoleucine patch superfamily)